MMERTHLLAVCLLLAFGLLVGPAWPYAIPKERQDSQQVYAGSLDRFERPGEVDMAAVIAQSPEYERIQEKKIKRGTGEYWILLEKASQRALRAVTVFAKNSDYDLITANGYLASVNTEIAVENVTEQVTEAMLED